MTLAFFLFVAHTHRCSAGTRFIRLCTGFGWSTATTRWWKSITTREHAIKSECHQNCISISASHQTNTNNKSTPPFLFTLNVAQSAIEILIVVVFFCDFYFAGGNLTATHVEWFKEGAIGSVSKSIFTTTAVATANANQVYRYSHCYGYLRMDFG